VVKLNNFKKLQSKTTVKCRFINCLRLILSCLRGR